MPEPERSLNEQKVLEEDEYTAALSHIIARDFFPSLVHLDATNDYLDAINSRDPHLIDASVRRLEQIACTPSTSSRRPSYGTPSQTPYGCGPSDTPVRTPQGEAQTKRARYDTSISLDTFQARYTSEDNSSFTQILDEENRKRKERWAWAWDAQKRVDENRKKLTERRERMLIEAPPLVGVREKFVIEAPTPAGLITEGRADGKEVEENVKSKEEPDSQKETQVMEPEEREEHLVVDVMAPTKDTRSTEVGGWKFKTRNSLMFSPDADESPYHPIHDLTKAETDLKVIKYGNTRLPEQRDSPSGSRGLSAPPSPTRSHIDAAISDRPRSPTMNGFSLVPNLPSPTPSELGPSAVKQLMTWGTLNATPRIISQPDDPAELSSLPPPSTPFHLPAPSSREIISHKLSSTASKSLRAKAGLLGLVRTPGISRTPAAIGREKKGAMAPPSWTPRRSDAVGNLTPAARRLLDKSTMGTAAARRAEAMERMAGWERSGRGKETDLNRVRWTPTPTPTTKT